MVKGLLSERLLSDSAIAISLKNFLFRVEYNLLAPPTFSPENVEGATFFITPPPK